MFIKIYSFLNKIKVFKYKIYLYYLSISISQTKNINDLIIFLKKISNYYNLNSDQLSNLLTDCFKYYPLKDIDLQKLSLWEQQFQSDLGIANFVSTLVWICSIISIQERQIKLIK